MARINKLVDFDIEGYKGKLHVLWTIYKTSWEWDVKQRKGGDSIEDEYSIPLDQPLEQVTDSILLFFAGAKVD